MSCESPLPAPSQPSDTVAPAAMYRVMGAIPDPSRMLDAGLWTSVAPEAATIATSSSSSHTEWARDVPGRSCGNSEVIGKK